MHSCWEQQCLELLRKLLVESLGDQLGRSDRLL
jgi:hypothetical protein